MAEVLAAMKEAGIGERDLQTSGFSINPRYVYPQNNDGSTPPRITGYDVTNTITVRVRDLARLGEIIDKSVDLGVNQGGQVDFGNADSKPALAEARAKAVEDAVARATTLATAAKVRIGRILEMTENSYNPGPVPIARTMAMKAEADAVPMAAGENAYSVTVNVTFAIDQ